MNEKVAKHAVFILFLAVVALVASRIWHFPRIFYATKREDPRNILVNANDYVFDAKTILSRLDHGEINLFIPASSDITTPQALGLFFWNQQEYMRVAEALHQLVWGESLNTWSLYSATFRIYQCRDDFNGFNQADFIFYQHEDGSYFVHEILITPSEGRAQAGGDYYGYSGAWKNIDLTNVKISDADSALALAEENGGKVFRSDMENDCEIYIFLSSDIIENNPWINMFNHNGWGWYVSYYGEGQNKFALAINPSTSQYEIQQ